jgi:hypothetical protein
MRRLASASKGLRSQEQGQGEIIYIFWRGRATPLPLALFALKTPYFDALRQYAKTFIKLAIISTQEGMTRDND